MFSNPQHPQHLQSHHCSHCEHKQYYFFVQVDAFIQVASTCTKMAIMDMLRLLRSLLNITCTVVKTEGGGVPKLILLSDSASFFPQIKESFFRVRGQSACCPYMGLPIKKGAFWEPCRHISTYKLPTILILNTDSL